MKTFHGIKFGGLQQKIFLLMLVIIIALIGCYATATLFLQKRLTAIVEDTNDKQLSSIETVSEDTMKGVIEQALSKSTALQANIADDLFTGVRSNVAILQTYAQVLFEHADEIIKHTPGYPDKANDGVPSIQMIHEEGVNPASSDDLGLIANMGDVMLAMYENSSDVGSFFVATTDGCLLFVNDRSGAYFDDNDEVVTLQIRERPWYIEATAAKKMIFTDVQLDSFTDIHCLECVAPVYHNDELVAVVGEDVFLSSISDYVRSSSNSDGFACVVSEKGHVLFSPLTEGIFKMGLTEETKDLRQDENKNVANFITSALAGKTGLQEISVDGKTYFMTGAPMTTTGWTVVSAVDKSVAYQPTAAMLQNYEEINDKALEEYEDGLKNSMNTIIVLTILLVVFALAGASFMAMRIARPLTRMTERINSLSGEDSVFEMEKVYKTRDEIQLLAESFASLSSKTRDYISRITEITAEKERIGTELSLATRIQADMLPNIYPAFPERNEFDIYASMNPAREVGGDFYDFFLVDDDHLYMTIADVSGKGVPAALFMMASRIILASNAKMGKSPAEILTLTNEAICQNNREEMFVTVWAGVLEISTGKLTAANAGHEYPILKKANGQFEIVKDKHGFVIGGMDGVKYKEYELQLTPGAKLFLYTDGVPEATAENQELFGMERLLAALNENPDATPEEMLCNVRKAVDDFVQEAEQFDDLTMLGLEYKGEAK